MGKWQAVFWSDHDRSVRACDTQADALAFLQGGRELGLLRPEALIDPDGRTVALPGDPAGWAAPAHRTRPTDWRADDDELACLLAHA